jgi:hypothetical protein
MKEEILKIRRELLDAIDNKSNTKEDLIRINEEIANKLLQLYNS